MKTFIYVWVLCATSFFIACSPSSPTAKESSKALTVKELEGSWVNAVYLDDLAKTRSPRQSFDKIGEIAQVSISSKGLKGDTLIGGLSYNGHEGGQYLIVFKAGKQPNSIRFGELLSDLQEATSDLIIENGLLTISHHEPNDGGRVKAPSRFRRISTTPQGIDDGNGIGVIQTLFTGDWMMTDAGGKITMIKIDSLGKVTDAPNFDQLSVLTDYTGPPTTYDFVTIMDTKQNKSQELHFKCSDKAIEFSETKGKKEVVLFTLSMYVQ